jgi:hypothetical protein
VHGFAVGDAVIVRAAYGGVDVDWSRNQLISESTRLPVGVPRVHLRGTTSPMLCVHCFLHIINSGHTISDQSAHILICTPGRLRHFVCSDRIVDLSLCRLLVLEECDKLLEADFSSELRETFEVK